MYCNIQMIHMNAQQNKYCITLLLNKSHHDNVVTLLKFRMFELKLLYELKHLNLKSNTTQTR